MPIKIALAGNPNSGKTTMFNDLTGSAQYVGNWPGVTVEKKEGRLKGSEDVIIQDLPGIYSLSPYTLEEVVTRTCLIVEKPDAILNIVDASNIERNLYLTTQLAELGIPMVVALNMIDVTRKNGDRIDLKKLGAALNCEVVETSALKGMGSAGAARRAAGLAAGSVSAGLPRVFTGRVEQAIRDIERLIAGRVDGRFLRWYAVKLFERDEKIEAGLKLPAGVREDIEQLVSACESELDDDAESIVTNQRYAYINRVVSSCVRKGRSKDSLTVSDKIDRVVTNRLLALPIFVAVMFTIYFIAVSTVGAIVTDFTNDVFVGEWIEEPVRASLEGWGVAGWLVGLVCDGIIGGAGAVLGFVPQMLMLFIMLAMLEDCGYMARVAFMMDRLFRKFGLSGKSFIPMLIGSGCGVPAVMASRTIEQDRDRKMTVMTTTFIPCGAKMPIIGMIAAALFGSGAWVATSAYFIGVAAIVVSGVMLKKTRPFAGNPAPFVMELPAYHAPTPANVLRSTWERGWSFIKRAGTVILVSSILIWFTSSYGWTPAPVEAPELADAAAETQTAGAQAVSGGDAPLVWGAVDNMDDSILGRLGNPVSAVFKPLGFGNMPCTVATVMGLVAKEEVVNVFGVLFHVDSDDATAADIVDDEAMSADDKAAALTPIAAAFDQSSGGHGRLGAYAFMIFNLLCAPCFAAMGAIRREMNNGQWTFFAIAYQCVFAYAISLIVYQLGLVLAGAGSVPGAAAAVALLALLIYLLVRPNRYGDNRLTQSVKVSA